MPDFGRTLHDQRMAMPHLRKTTGFATLLSVATQHVHAIEEGRAYPSGELLNRWLPLIELPPEKQGKLWEELARHQMDLIVGERVTIRARRVK